MPSSEKVKHGKKKASKAHIQPLEVGGDAQMTGGPISAAPRPKPVADEVIREVRDNAVAKLRNATKAQNGKADEALNWLHFVQTIDRQYDFTEAEATGDSE
jgi:hypothetical protein